MSTLLSKQAGSKESQDKELVFDTRPQRLLDVRVAREVLGFETRELIGDLGDDEAAHHVAWLMRAPDNPVWEPLPRFSTDEKSAHQIMAFVQGHGVKVDLNYNRGWWWLSIEGQDYPKARKRPLAITRAALGFVGEG